MNINSLTGEDSFFLGMLQVSGICLENDFCNIYLCFRKDGSCPHLQKNNCTWETSDGIDFDMVLLNFSVKVTNTKTNDLKLTENLFIEQNANGKSAWIVIGQLNSCFLSY